MKANQIQELRSSGIELHVFHFGTHLRRLRQSKKWKDTLEIFRQMQILQVRANEVIVNTAIDIQGKGRQWLRACHLLDVLSPQHALHRDVVGTSSAVSSLRGARPSPIHSAAWSAALQLNAGRWLRSLVLCNAVLSTMEAHWTVALQMLRWSMTQIIVDTISYSAALSACASSGLWSQSFEMIREMEEREVTTDLISSNTCIHALEQTGSRWLVALLSFADLQPQRMEPSVVSVTSTMNACHKATTWTFALAVHHATQRGIAGSRVRSNSLLNALARGSRWRDVISDAMAVSDATGLMGILEGLGTTQWQRFLHLFRHVENYQPHCVDAVCFNAVLSTLENAGQWPLCVEVLEEMRKLSMELSLSSYGPLLGLDFGKELLEEMKTAQVVMDTLALSLAVESTGSTRCDAGDAVWTQGCMAELQAFATQGLFSTTGCTENTRERRRKKQY